MPKIYKTLNLLAIIIGSIIGWKLLAIGNIFAAIFIGGMVADYLFSFIAGNFVHRPKATNFGEALFASLLMIAILAGIGALIGWGVGGHAVDGLWLGLTISNFAPSYIKYDKQK